MKYLIDIDEDGNPFIICLNADCEVYGRPSYSAGDIENVFCSCCGYHDDREEK